MMMVMVLHSDVSQRSQEKNQLSQLKERLGLKIISSMMKKSRILFQKFIGSIDTDLVPNLKTSMLTKDKLCTELVILAQRNLRLCFETT